MKYQHADIRDEQLERRQRSLLGPRKLHLAPFSNAFLRHSVDFKLAL